jgi:hypothetical protein
MLNFKSLCGVEGDEKARYPTGAWMLNIILFSVVLKFFHPLWPVFWCDTAGLGPGAVCIIVAMPFQSPQLLESNSSDRPVQESGIYKSIVPVDAEMQHFVIDAQPLAIELRRLTADAGVVRPTAFPHSIAENWCIISAFNMGSIPIPFSRAALNLSQSRPEVKSPVICPIAAFLLQVLWPAGCHSEGAERSAIHIPPSGAFGRFRSHRASKYIRPCLPVSPQRVYP